MTSLNEQPWYHGPMTRISAELSLQHDGDFLVRDCISSPGDFVLTCRWRGQVLHFRMNRTTFDGNVPCLYQFEDEAFGTVLELIMHHWQKQCPISQLSGALIKTPVYKTKEVLMKRRSSSDVYSTKSDTASQQEPAQKPSSYYYFGEDQGKAFQRPVDDDLPPPPPPLPSALISPTEKGEGVEQRRQSHSLSLIIEAARNTLKRRSGSLKRPKSTECISWTRKTNNLFSLTTFKRFSSESSITLPLTLNKAPVQKTDDQADLGKRVPFPNDIELTENECVHKPTPTYDVPKSKPRSCLSDRQIELSPLYDQPRVLRKTGGGKKSNPPLPPPRGKHLAKSYQSAVKDGPPASGVLSDPDSFSLFSEVSQTDTSLLEHRELTPLLSSSDNDNESLVFDNDESVKKDMVKNGYYVTASTSSSSLPSHSLFSPCTFDTPLIANGLSNKALDPRAIIAANKLLLNNSGRMLAAHLTKLDADLLSIQLDKSYPKMTGIRSGVYLITLVDGKHLRLDVMERFLCLRHFVLISIFSAPNWSQSARLLARWMEIAWECATTDLCNHFSLHAIITALQNPKLKAIESLWTILAQQNGDALQRFRQTLQPMVNSINTLQDESPAPAPVVVPHLIPFISGSKDLKDLRTFRQVFQEVYANAENGSNGSHQAQDEGVSMLFEGHLRRVQSYVDNAHDLKGRADAVFAHFEFDPRISDIFRTEFHLRVLWGSKGCTAAFEDRHSKFDKVIAALAKICTNIDDEMSKMKPTKEGQSQ